MIAIDIMNRPNPELVTSFTAGKRRIFPGRFDVICARGKQAYNHEGNRYFRKIIHHATEKYSKVESKLQRSMIVTDIVDAIRAKGNGFIRKNSQGEWIECSDVMCREKVGQHFRNALGCQYKSSSKSKRIIKEESMPQLINKLQKVVFSSKAVTEITERLSMDLIFIDETDDDAFLEKAFAANMDLLQTFKEDACLVKQFEHNFNLGQQQRTLPDRSRNGRSHALAA